MVHWESDSVSLSRNRLSMRNKGSEEVARLWSGDVLLNLSCLYTTQSVDQRYISFLPSSCTPTQERQWQDCLAYGNDERKASLSRFGRDSLPLRLFLLAGGLDHGAGLDRLLFIISVYSRHSTSRPFMLAESTVISWCGPGPNLTFLPSKPLPL